MYIVHSPNPEHEGWTSFFPFKKSPGADSDPEKDSRHFIRVERVPPFFLVSKFIDENIVKIREKWSCCFQYSSSHRYIYYMRLPIEFLNL